MSMKQAWQSGSHSGLVTLPNNQKLHLHATGPARPDSHTPAIIIEHGLGGSAAEWVVAVRMLSAFARVFIYERAGYFPSSPPLDPPTPTNVAANLKLLLQTVDIAPPYLLVGHSYGGTLVRQYLADFPEDVCGMVIKDAAPVLTPFPDCWTTLLGATSTEDLMPRYFDVVGIARDRTLNDAEWTTMLDHTSRNEGPGSIEERELGCMKEEQRVLNDRLRGSALLGIKPLSVIFNDTGVDFRKVYEYGVQHGFGTDEDREAVRSRLETFSRDEEAANREHLALSENARFVKAEGKARTHNSQLVAPELVVEEIRWVYRQCLQVL